jgi:hypothetical protein
MKKSVLYGFFLLVTILIVAATATIPTVLSPANNSVFFDNNITLTCSGSGAVNYSFYGNGEELQNSLSTTYDWNNLDYTTHNWTCRSCIEGSTFLDYVGGNFLLAYYSFDNANLTGNNVHDLTKNIRNGTNIGATTGVVGILDEAFNYDGGPASGNDWVGIADDIQTRLLNGGTVNLWTKMTGLDNGARLFSKCDGVSQGVNGYELLFDNSADTLQFYMDSNLAIESDGGIDTTYSDWSMVTVLIKDSGYGSIYINGTNVTSIAYSRNVPDSTGYNFTIANRAVSLSRGWGEYIDEFGIWNNTLNDGEITDIYNSGLGLSYSSVPVNTTIKDCSSQANSRTVNIANFTNCTTGNIALNISFINESKETSTNGTISLLDFTFDSDDAGDYNYLFTGLNTNNQKFCLFPSGVDIPVVGEIKYDGNDFPQRTIAFTETLNGDTIIDQPLYLLQTTDGIFVTLQVLNSANQPIENVAVTIRRQTATGTILVSGGLTDGAGTMTSFLNPDFTHIFTLSKTGFQIYVTSFSPTQSVYTINLADSGAINTTNTNTGIQFGITPTLVTLSNQTNYTFGFTLSSDNQTIESFGFNLTNQDGDLLDSVSSSGSGSVSSVTNTTNNTRIDMAYYWIIDGVTSSGVKGWAVINTEQGSFSLKTFFDDLKNFNGFGINDFSKNLIAFLLIFALVAVTSMTLGRTVINDEGSILLIIFLTWFLEYVGLITTIATPLNIPFMTSILVGVMGGGWILYNRTR